MEAEGRSTKKVWKLKKAQNCLETEGSRTGIIWKLKEPEPFGSEKVTGADMLQVGIQLIWLGLYHYYIVQISELEKGYLKKTVAHELGHAMELSHRICNPNSIMYNYVGTVNVDTPQLIDSRTVYHIYSR